MRQTLGLLLAPLVCNVAAAQVGDIVGVHDPCIIKENNVYYVYSTGRRIKARRSRDLKSWESLNEILADLPQWATDAVPGARDRWAPDISFFKGRYHLYYSISTFGSNRSCIAMATNVTLDPNSPNYKWEEQGIVFRSNPPGDRFNAIDPNVILDETGQPWMTFGSFWDGIMLVRLDPQTGIATGAPQLIAGRKGGAIEAPFLIRHDNQYYLFVSFDQCCKGINSTYRIMLGRSPKVDGPYVDATGKAMLDGGGTELLAGRAHVRGPGHNAVLREPGQDYLVHHFYDATNNGRATLQIRPLNWGPDGWPSAGEPVTDAAKQDP